MNLPCCSSCSRRIMPASPSRQRIRPVLPSVVEPLSGLIGWPFSSQACTAKAASAPPPSASAISAGARRAGARRAAAWRSTRRLCRAPAASKELVGDEPAEQHVVHPQPEGRLRLDRQDRHLVVLACQPLQVGAL